MCRIAGIINNSLSEDELLYRIDSMTKAMSKGGPDGEGKIIIDSHNLVFGHRRLAIIDLTEQGDQPMCYQDKFWITFNGEIYNFQELKNNLILKGYTFKSNSDTEVILIGYSDEGISFFEKLNGMFAFALLDKDKNQTHLVRDSQGIKPLYYSENGNSLIFASEVKAFRALNNDWKENDDWKVYFLSFGFIPEPFTTLDKVFSLPKGHYLTWSHQSNDYKIIKYTAEYPQQIDLSEHVAIEQLNNSLKNSVKSHLISDAPIGVFLSGGIDSSLLCLLANQQVVGKKINTISVNFKEDDYSEQEYQKLIADKIGSNHIEYKITKQDFEKYIHQIFEEMDQPSNDGVNSWFVCKKAKDVGLKAVLSGLGADELFGGYPSFKRYKLISNLKKLPKFILGLAKYLPNDKLKRISFLSYRNPIGEYLFLRGFFTPQVTAALLNREVKEIDCILSNYQLPKEINNLSAENRISWFETNIYMQNQLLKDTDYMSMAHGVEVRVPFLEQNLVNLAQSFKKDIRFDSKQPKHLLIKTFKDILPREIWDRNKKGFTFPFQQWFKNYSPILEKSQYKSNKEAEKLVDQFRNNQLHWSKLFAVYQVFKNAS